MTWAAFAAALGAAAAASPAAAGPDSWHILRELAAFGNRHAGASRRPEAIARLKKRLSRAGLSVSRQDFTAKDPRDGRDWPMTNLLGRLRPKAACRILLGSHYDTRHVAEMDPDPRRRDEPIEGGNDGTSGVAVLLALAPRLSRLLPSGVGADVVLFDGEEMGYPNIGGYCAGSTHYASRLPAGTKPAFGIVLDMVCAPDTHFKIESRSHESHPDLVEALWSLGAARSPAFSRQHWGGIGDDHTPLTRAGIPSILVIGYDDPRWHTSRDTAARCDPDRLALMESVLEDFMRTRLAEFLPGCRG